MVLVPESGRRGRPSTNTQEAHPMILIPDADAALLAHVIYTLGNKVDWFEKHENPNDFNSWREWFDDDELHAVDQLCEVRNMVESDPHPPVDLDVNAGQALLAAVATMVEEYVSGDPDCLTWSDTMTSVIIAAERIGLVEA
jgi:hypothetical protein